MYGYQILQNFVQTYTLFFIGNPLICDCELRWYHQWIEEEWNPVEEQWLKETFCKDPADNQRHNIAEVPLKDMFCTGDVTDKPSARVSSTRESNTNLNAYSTLSQWLKITQNVAIWGVLKFGIFSNFCPFKLTYLVTLLGRKLQFFEIAHFLHF